METTREHITPLSHDLTIIFNDLKKIVQSVQSQMNSVGEGVTELKEAAVRIGHFEKIVQEKLEQPILEFAALVSAITSALQAFFHFWKKSS